ncbi:DUF5808 domain-containing protein [Chloroflexota bacterium]
MSKNSSKIGNLLNILAAILIASAVYQELKKPADERTWNGKIANFIPYDLRLPTVERLRERLWNPEDSRIFTEHVFGVGWAINFHTVFRKLSRSRKEPEKPLPEDPD